MPSEQTSVGDFGDEEILALFSGVAKPSADTGGIVLAVSGGPDSTALLLLFTRYQELRASCGAAPLPALVATVDHGLREASAAEGARVASLSARLGLEHAVLRWEGRKPVAGISEAAREARYGLLADLMRVRGYDALVTAHTLEDQAETLLMRLARGSGVDGLAGMAPVSWFSEPALRLVRPLLSVPKSRLLGLLRACGEGWAEDPTNLDQSYERPRWRAHGKALEEAGLRAGAIALVARRLRRASEALDGVTRSFFRSPAVQVAPLGFIVVERGAYEQLAEEIQLRVLSMAIGWAGGMARVSLSALEGLHQRVAAGNEGGFTLARALVKPTSAKLVITREPGRVALPVAPLAPDADLLWDGRFWVRTGRFEREGLAVGALGAAGLAAAERMGLERPPGAPVGALRALPAVWRTEELLAVPSLDFDPRQLQLPIRTEFKGIARANSVQSS